MEGGVKGRIGGGGGREAISCSPEKMYHRNSSGNFTQVHVVGVLELVREPSAKRRPQDGGAVEIRFRKAETNEEEVEPRERRVKDVAGWEGWGARKTICHFPPRGQGTRAASLRGFLQISSRVSSVSPVWPVEAR